MQLLNLISATSILISQFILLTQLSIALSYVCFQPWIFCTVLLCVNITPINEKHKNESQHGNVLFGFYPLIAWRKSILIRWEVLGYSRNSHILWNITIDTRSCHWSVFRARWILLACPHQIYLMNQFNNTFTFRFFHQNIVRIFSPVHATHPA